MNKESLSIVLDNIFSFQKSLQNKLYNVTLPDDVPDLQKVYALGIYTELGEAMATDKSWKDWRKQETSKEIKEQRKDEIADVWIFLINYSLSCGMDLNDVLEAITNKQQTLNNRHGGVNIV